MNEEEKIGVGSYNLFRCGNFHIDSILPPREIKNINYNEMEEKEEIIDTYNLNLKNNVLILYIISMGN